MLWPLAHLGLQGSCSSESDGDSCLREERLQVENERLVNELVQLQERATLVEEAMKQRDRET